MGRYKIWLYAETSVVSGATFDAVIPRSPELVEGRRRNLPYKQIASLAMTAIKVKMRPMRTISREVPIYRNPSETARQSRQLADE